jgi:hypothetical protein
MLFAAGGGKPKAFTACKFDKNIFKPLYQPQLLRMGAFIMALRKKI